MGSQSQTRLSDFHSLTCPSWAFQVLQWVKNPPANAGDPGDAGLIPGLGRSPGEGTGNLLQYSCLGNPTDRGAWRATVHGVAESNLTERQSTYFVQVQPLSTSLCQVSLGWASVAGSRHVTKKIPFPSKGLRPAGPWTPLEVFTDPLCPRQVKAHSVTDFHAGVCLSEHGEGGLTKVFLWRRCWGVAVLPQGGGRCSDAGQAEPLGPPGLVGQQPAHPLPGGTRTGYERQPPAPVPGTPGLRDGGQLCRSHWWSPPSHLVSA